MTVPEQTWVYTPELSTLRNMALATVFWTVLYILITYIPLPKYKALKTSEGKPIEVKRSEILDTQNRIVSFIHGLLCIGICIYDVNYLQLPCGSPNHPIETFLLTVSFGYFLYDFLAMAYYGLLDSSMTIHHFIC